MKRAVCYTCITGGYDNIPVHKYVHPDWDYVLFTDNDELIAKGTFEHWSVRPLMYNKSTNVKNARWHKINTHILFPEYELSLWLDGNISVNNQNIFDKINQLVLDTVLISIPLHPHRNCIYDEANEIKRLHIDTNKTVNEQMHILHKNKYPANKGLSETNIIFRQHNKIKPLLDLWWMFVYNYSKRDQLSYNYCAWKCGVQTNALYPTPGEHRNNGDFDFRYIATHNQDKVYTTNKLPYWLGRIIAAFIPKQKNRHRFIIKHVNPRKQK